MLFRSAIIFLMSISVSFWSPYLANVQNKNNKSVDAGGITSSRDILWENRINEFNSSPLFGVGFSSISLDSNGSSFDKNKGKVETGSSWLNILSMTGIVGFICFSIIWIRAMFLLYKQFMKNNRVATYLFALLIFGTRHMTAEGYIFAAGSILVFFVWLLLGCIYISCKKPKYLLLYGI